MKSPVWLLTSSQIATSKVGATAPTFLSAAAKVMQRIGANLANGRSPLTLCKPCIAPINLLHVACDRGATSSSSRHGRQNRHRHPPICASSFSSANSSTNGRARNPGQSAGGPPGNAAASAPGGTRRRPGVPPTDHRDSRSAAHRRDKYLTPTRASALRDG